MREAREAPRVARPRRAAPDAALRPTRAEINLGALRHNYRAVLRAAASEGRVPEVWGVLKADAYGHGAPAVARTLERAGMPGICVALLEEALELRSAGIRIPILVMGGYYGPRGAGLEAIAEHDLLPVVHDGGQLEGLERLACELGRTLPVHLKVDTGMGRLGAPEREVEALLRRLAGAPSLRLDGLMTHLACADAPDLEVTRAQLARFDAVAARARGLGLRPRLLHAANSAASLRAVELPSARYGMIRPGVALFGVAPAPGLGEGLRPVMRVRSEVVSLRSVGQGEGLGYGHTFRARRPTLVATVPMGYADGLSRQLSNKGSVLVRGRRAPIAGAVSMDLTTIDVTDVPGASVGDEVVFLGTQEGPLGQGAIGADEIAELAGTIPWEILTMVSRRVPRFYREP